MTWSVMDPPPFCPDHVGMPPSATCSHYVDNRTAGAFVFLPIINGFVEIDGGLRAMDPRRLSRVNPKTPDPFADEVDEPDATVPLTAAEATAWRQRHPMLSPWRVVAAQALVGVLATVVAALLGDRAAVAASAGYGALCVVLPAALFAHGLVRAFRKSASGRGAAPAAWMGWEIAKLAASIAMLLLAPAVVPGLNWLALLVGMVVTMKAVWVVLWLQPRARRAN
jgi:ATP synthase protein I